MFSVKTIMLVTGLASLICQPQAWAMDDLDNPGTAASAGLQISQRHKKGYTQRKRKTLDAAAQLQMERRKNERLKALKTAIRAENKELKAKLAALLQAAQSAPAPAN